MARSPYEVLGLDAEASPAEIKKAYRALARRYHPDVSDEPDAEARFKEVGAAFETLQDPRARARWSVGIERGGPDRAYLEHFTDAVERAELIWFQVLLPGAFSLGVGPAERVALLAQDYAEGRLEEPGRWQPASFWGTRRAMACKRRVEVRIEYRPTLRPSASYALPGGGRWLVVLGPRAFFDGGVRTPEELDAAVLEHLSVQLLAVLASEVGLSRLMEGGVDRARAYDAGRWRRWMRRWALWLVVGAISAALLAFGLYG